VQYDAGACRLFNHYGPTETTVGVVVHAVDGPSDASPGIVPMGRALPNCAVYVLDPCMELAPIGCAGELYVGGEYVTRGYLAQPGMTAGRFVPDGNGENPGRRLYRTGDRVRWNNAGQLEFLGREDDQVKINGFRVELGEIEATLATHPDIRQVVVEARRTATASIELVAYLVTTAEQGLDTAGMYKWLSGKLPAPMVPKYFVTLESLPRSSHGKLDRRALPELALAQASVPPETAAEHALASVWQQMLGRATIGRNDDFFALGGHSLLAIRLLAEVRHRTGVEMSLQDLFQAPTLSDMALRFPPDWTPLPLPPQPAADNLALVVLQQGASRPLYVVHPVGGSVACYAQLVQSMGARQTVYGLQALSSGDARAIGSVEQMAERYVREMIRAQPEPPYQIAGWSSGGVVAYEIARQLAAAGKAIGLLALLDAQLSDSAADGVACDDKTVWQAFVHHMCRENEVARAAVGLAKSLATEDVAGLASALQELTAGGFLATDLSQAFLVFAANFRALRRYRPGAFDGELVMLRPTASRTPALLTELAPRCRVEVVPGDHYSLLRPASLPVVLQILRPLLH
jgi:thioesterase domain-containing protein